MLDEMAYWKFSKFANKKFVGVFFFQKYRNFQRVSLDHFNKMYNKVWTYFFLKSEIVIQ